MRAYMASRIQRVLGLAAYATAAAVLDMQSSSPSLSDEMSLVQAARDIPQESPDRTAVRSYSGMELSQTFQLMAATLPDGSTKEMLSSFKVCASCKNFRRLGEEKDGGYLFCMDGLEGGHIRAAYSMGVEHHDKFSDDIYTLFKVPVYQFDCTVNGPATRCPECHFNRVCLKGKHGGGAHPKGPNMDMAQAVKHTGQESAPEDSLVMKMDIEGAEWPIYADGRDGLEKFKQLIFEFHWLGKEDRHAEYVKALRNIASAGFKVAHIHGNNYRKMYTKGNYSVPDVIEVTYVKNNLALDACETDQHLHPLDHKNGNHAGELPMAHLPE